MSGMEPGEPSIWPTLLVKGLIIAMAALTAVS